MGVVYLAHDPILERELAIKVMTPDLLSPDAVERFKREAEVVAKMDHPCIVGIYDFGEHDGSLFLIMPFVEGTNLRTLLNEEIAQPGRCSRHGDPGCGGSRIQSFEKRRASRHQTGKHHGGEAGSLGR